MNPDDFRPAELGPGVELAAGLRMWSAAGPVRQVLRRDGRQVIFALGVGSRRRAIVVTAGEPAEARAWGKLPRGLAALDGAPWIALAQAFFLQLDNE